MVNSLSVQPAPVKHLCEPCRYTTLGATQTVGCPVVSEVKAAGLCGAVRGEEEEGGGSRAALRVSSCIFATKTFTDPHFRDELSYCSK